jgi:hypothetical protein
MTPLLAFYRGNATDTEGRTLAAMWAFSDDEMEAHHDFIQWMFPLREPSRFNPDAPLLTPGDIDAFQREPELRLNVRRSLDRFLAFVGLEADERGVRPSAEFDRKREVWRYPNHNWLRITRVLHSLRLLGLDDEAQSFFACLSNLRQTGKAAITPETFAYWTDAAR